jgi:trans-aconitate methyltransferase
MTATLQRAIDVGCGTGIWSIDFADEYPSTTVLGVDLSPIQPNLVPPNCSFEVDDARDPWIYDRDYFDFVYIRNLAGSIRDWPGLYKQAFE